MEYTTATEMLTALSHETRLKLYRLLVLRGPQGWPAGVLAEKLGIAPPILSFHAKALEQAGLVESHTDGRLNIYTANFKAMSSLVNFLGSECCAQADPECAKDCIPVAAVRRRKRA